MNPNSFTINGKKIPVETELLDIFDLRFYPENPRINYVLSKYGNRLTQEIIEQELWSQDSVKLLAEDIERNGGLIEEVIVYQNKVVEGNSRLCAYRKIYERSSSEEKKNWLKIKCKVIQNEIKDNELYYLLGQYHLRGKTPWDPFEKASYIYKMINVDGFSVKEVVKNFGMREASINNQEKAYVLMRDEYLPLITDVEDQKNELKKFSIFEEYFKSAPLQNFVKAHDDILNDSIFVQWVREGRIKSAVFDVRKALPSILNNKEARNVLLTEDKDVALKKSEKILYKDHPELIDDFYQIMKKATDALKEAKIIDISDDMRTNGSSKQILDKFHSSVNMFYRNLEKYEDK